MDHTPPPETPAPRRRTQLARVILALRWPGVVLALLVLIYLAYLKACWTLERAPSATGEAVREAAQGAARIAERFHSGRITETFVATLPQLVPGSVRLELAAFEAVETFTRTDDRRILFDVIPLGTTVTEIRVPVTYRYHVRLDEPWRLTVENHHCRVEAPPLRPTLPPAIHTDRMEKRSERGWLRFNAGDQMAMLERSITPVLAHRANRAEQLELVRELCRTRLAEFVRGWLLREDHWGGGRFTAITVRFADETEAVPTPPTLEIERAGVEPP